MARINPKLFCDDPSVDKLLNVDIRKDDWRFIANHFSIGYPSKATKEVIKNTVVEGLVAEEVLPREAIDLVTPATSSPSPVEMSGRKEDREESITSGDGWSSERLEFEKEKLIMQMRIRQQELEQDRELRKQELEFKHRELDQNRDLETRKLYKKSQFDLKKAVTLVPSFTESDPDGFFRSFEKTAIHLEWPKSEWPWLIQRALVGKAALVYNNLDDTSDYAFVKTAILDSYAITVDGYRQRFRSYIMSPQETFLEFATEKLRRFKKWLEATQTNSYLDLLNLMVLEEFKRRLPFQILCHVEQSKETDLIKAAQLADAQHLLLKSLPYREKPGGKASSVKVSFSPKAGPGDKQGEDPRVCSYCKKPGHVIRNCPQPQCRVSTSGLGSFVKPYSDKQLDVSRRSVSNIAVPVTPEDSFANFKSQGQILLTPSGPSYPVTILRDTGSSQTILYAPSVPKVKSKCTGEYVIVQDLTSTPKLKIAKVYLDSGLVKGEVKLALRDQELPVQGTQLILGNDLAGTVVVPNLEVVNSPLKESPTAKLEEKQPDLFPLCAVTRSQSQQDGNQTSIPSPVPSLPSQVISRDNLILAQDHDPSLATFRNQVCEKSDLGRLPAYYRDKGILMRAFRPPELRQLDSWGEIHQIVAPLSIRQDLMEIAHDGLAGHLGVRKTVKKLTTHYYWPKLQQDVTNFIKSCHVCQTVGKPSQPIPVAPLKPIPVLDEPFNKIIIDCVGPLPRTRKGHQYLLTVMCASTRYPEAFPLKSITAKNIVSQLLNMFTKVGIPKSIQSDRGSNFTSGLFQQVLRELDIRQDLSSAYHPQSQGCLERFHQTFKTMLRKYCLETQEDWDEGVPFLLFALRECPQDTLGYSPFELLYGRQIRGPLKVLKDQWFSEAPLPPNLTVSQYVSDLKVKMAEARKVALKNLKSTQTKMKIAYDLKSVPRQFSPGEEVLLYLPMPGNPLKSKFTGPYVVQEKLSEVNYIIITPDRRKDTQLVHINLMKPYLRREEKVLKTNQVSCISTADVRVKPGEEIVDFPEAKKNPPNSVILNNLGKHLPTLTNSQQKDIITLLTSYPQVVSDVPGRCNIINHDVELTSPQTSPVRQAAYRLNPLKKEVMKAEVEYLLTNNLAEPSKSPWASPCLLTPKPDGSSRFCTDYRKVNQLTIPDSYPLPLIDDLIDAVGQSKFVTTIDLQKGYYQIGLTERAKIISAFITPFGLFQYRVLPFGMRNAPATFQRVINCTIQGLEGTFAYLDDLVVISDTWEDHVIRLKALLDRLSQAGFTINLAKTTFGSAVVTYLGHVVGRGQARPKEANVQAVLQCPVPPDRKSLMRFLGMAGFYRRFCSNFSVVAAPLTDLTSPKVLFKWTAECDAAYVKLKQLLSSDPVLRTPDPTQPFTLYVDASSQGIGAVLMQLDNEKILHPVSYFSMKLKSPQKNYSTVELETLALVKSLEKFQCYLYNHPRPIRIFTDHNPLTFLHKMQNTNQRLLRWALFLQQYTLDIQHVRGRDNILADTLSRIHTDKC